MTSKEWNTYFAGHWNIPGVRQQDHPAVFPEEIPKRLIKMFSFVGETVLDPFLGSGTTSLAAMNLARNSVGYEVNPEYRPMIERKVGFRGCGLFDRKVRVEFEERSTSARRMDERRAKLPYLFHDPKHFDKRVDPRRRGFGSKTARAFSS